jgi:FKBP-type peptidyl-prolyl cis-trans isomerase SlyD
MSEQKVISFHYTLTDDRGVTLDQSESGEPLSFLTGSGQIIPGLESELLTLQTGAKKRISVDPENAYGTRDDSKVFQIKRAQLPPGELNLGDMFHAQEGEDVVTVVAMDGDSVTLDGNHPLAGMRLNFDVEVAGIRAATHEEVSHGHAHGADGHHHH